MEFRTLEVFYSVATLKSFARAADALYMTQPAVSQRIASLEAALETVKTLTPDMAATDLQAAQAALGEITGDQADEKLLDAVFSQFCVGK